MKSPSKVTKVVWLVGTLCGFSVGILMVVMIVQQYLSYQTVVRIEKCHDCQPNFPDVTICHRNVLSAFTSEHRPTYEQYKSALNDTLYAFPFVFTDELLEVFDWLYTTEAYVENLDWNYYIDVISALAGNNFLIHHCEW